MAPGQEEPTTKQLGRPTAKGEWKFMIGKGGASKEQVTWGKNKQGTKGEHGADGL